MNVHWLEVEIYNLVETAFAINDYEVGQTNGFCNLR